MLTVAKRTGATSRSECPTGRTSFQDCGMRLRRRTGRQAKSQDGISMPPNHDDGLCELPHKYRGSPIRGPMQIVWNSNVSFSVWVSLIHVPHGTTCAAGDRNHGCVINLTTRSLGFILSYLRRSDLQFKFPCCSIIDAEVAILESEYPIFLVYSDTRANRCPSTVMQVWLGPRVGCASFRREEAAITIDAKLG